MKRANRDLRRGKSKSTAAGEFVREEMHHIREGKHGARSTKQAIAIGLAKARRAGYDPGTPKSGSRATKKAAARDTKAGRHPHAPSRTRSRAAEKALKREPHRAASKKALSRHAHTVAKRRGPAARKAAARKAARTRARAARA
ncbi:MAG: hypothetical protein ABI678_28640 [Kofleriaceae bacterium]